ncbi:unnamed protein product [Debaryomyces fabryi]|nr:unnamed protein product [Debaryomyces fabryi]
MDSSPNNRGTSQYQPMSSKKPFSSPIKPSDASASYDMDILEDLHQHQQDRANRIHYPLSSPIRNVLDHEHRRSSQYHHQNQQGRTSIINKRNKHDRLREIRDRHRQDKLGINREKMVDRQAYEDYKLELEREANELYDVLDIDELINQENELESYINESLPRHMYETELDAILNEEQQELEQMVANIDLSDNKYAST